MTREKEFGHKALKPQYCKGFVDGNNHWNNGFMCPGKEVGNTVEYCCGTESHRYCCIEETHVTQEDSPVHFETVIPAVLIGVAVILLIIMIICTLLVCYFYEYCPLYKRRTKRCQDDFALYEGDATAFTNELVPRNYSKGSHDMDISESEIKTTTQDEEKQHCIHHKPVLDTKSAKDEKKAGGLLSSVAFNSKRGCTYKNPVALTTERDSGCFVTGAECDSRMCLCDRDTVAEHSVWSPQSDAARHSWPVDSSIYEDISNDSSLDKEAVADSSFIWVSGK